jgi:hypothetical protein
MRLYIQQVTQHSQGKEPTTFRLAESIDNAWFWRTQEDAERALSVWNGIKTTKDGTECSDVKVEPRPNGGFVISCESANPATQEAETAAAASQ